MNNLDLQYQNLLQDILDNGIKKKDRTGTGTLSVFGRQIRHKMSDGFPLLTTKRIKFDLVVTELLWFLRGDTNIRYLVNNNCHIWDGDAYKNYVNTLRKTHSVHYEPMGMPEFIERIKTDDEFAKKWGDLGSIYGKQWRKWEKRKELARLKNSNVDSLTQGIYDSIEIDQIANLIQDLKSNPDSRRLIVSAWNPGEIDAAVLPPCHYGFQVWTRELTLKERHQLVRQYGLCPKYGFDIIDGKAVALPITEMEHYDNYHVPKRTLSLKWTQRSCDVFLGIPFNIASYGLLLHLLAKEVNMVPDELIFSGGDCHIYLNHLEQCDKQLKQQTYKLPSVEIKNKSIFDITYDDIKLMDYVSSPAIKGKLSN
jgi:thymidylate synthase